MFAIVIVIVLNLYVYSVPVVDLRSFVRCDRHRLLVVVAAAASGSSLSLHSHFHYIIYLNFSF